MTQLFDVNRLVNRFGSMFLKSSYLVFSSIDFPIDCNQTLSELKISTIDCPIDCICHRWGHFSNDTLSIDLPIDSLSAGMPLWLIQSIYQSMCYHQVWFVKCSIDFLQIRGYWLVHFPFLINLIDCLIDCTFTNT